MKYNIQSISIPQDKRAAINDRILALIDSNDMQGISPEDIFNAYTGIGGLHGLDRADYANYHKYAEAKKEIENGQFFTPAPIAQKISSLIDLKPYETIADITCGAGVFANFFAEPNFYGCDIEPKAIKIAKHLFPAANIVQGNIMSYKPPVMLDFIVGNPPFNLKWRENEHIYKSQEYYFLKAATLLRPAGIIIAIVPASFCADDFSNKNDIATLDRHFNFIFNYNLPADTFASMGVNYYQTKIIALQKKISRTDDIPYNTDNVSWEEASIKMQQHIKILRDMRIKANAEMTNEEKQAIFTAKKYLFEIKTHKSISAHYPYAAELLNKYINQSCPDGMTYNEWEKKYKITTNKLLNPLRKIIAQQNIREKDTVKTVKSKYAIYNKAYSKKSKAELSKQGGAGKYSIFDILYNSRNITYQLDNGMDKLIQRKKKDYLIHAQSYDEMRINPVIDNYLCSFTWINKDGEACKFNNIQKTDLNKNFQKRYGILNWQQGSGKTSAAYAWSLYNKQRKTFIVSAALSINLTWCNFLTMQGAKFVNIKSLADIDAINSADYVLISHEYIIKYERHIKKYVKQSANKVSFILDESDDITNHISKRTKAIKNCFQRAKRKLLTTGTTTRNNIAELYSQLELLFNNSINMVCTPHIIYKEDKEDKQIKETINQYHNMPFPAYYGNKLFQNCFNPTKTTVLGIGQHDQSIYNEKHLRKIIDRTIITRKFKEIAGDRYKISSVSVRQSEAEKNLYKKILKDTEEVINRHFQSTGNSRKDSQLKIIRQITLLIKATSMPHYFTEYEGSTGPNKTDAIIAETKKRSGKIAIGCTSIDAVEYYYSKMQHEFPDRKVFMIVGDVQINKRGSIIKQFEDTENGILVCTQQSLKSSVNIPSCDNVFIESKQWNMPKMEQFYFRFIRYDMANTTDVVFFNYTDTIEANLLALLMAKERLNDYIKTKEYRDNEDIYNEFDIDLDILSSLMVKDKDEKGNIHLRWGQQSFAPELDLKIA